MKETTITLAGKTYVIQPLTLGQLEDHDVAVSLPDSTDPRENTRRSYVRVREVIASALADGYPEMTAEALKKLRVSRDELMGAYNAVLVHSGLVPKEKDKRPGEEEPPAAGATTGVSSSEGSQPA